MQSDGYSNTQSVLMPTKYYLASLTMTSCNSHDFGSEDVKPAEHY